MKRLSKSIYAVQGKFAPLDGLWDDEWYVIRETWNGAAIVNTELIGHFRTYRQAAEKVETIKAAAALGRKGGKSTSEAKRAAARRNGRKGGRPRKKK